MSRIRTFFVVITWCVAAQAQTTSWSTGTYVYDGAGNIKSIGTDDFRYDGLGRLVSGEAAGSTQIVSYDAFGNIKTIKTGGGSALTVGVHSATNQVTDSTRNIYASYDLAGRVTQTMSGPTSGGADLEYDAVDMVKRIETASGDYVMLYTASDERIATVTTSTASRLYEFTLRDPSGKVLRRINRQGFTWTWKQDYIYHGSRLLAAEVDTPTRTLHFFADHLGTPRLITGNGGNRIALHHYYPFGGEATSTLQDSEALKFTGHERDAASGMDYMHARYYMAGWGRFLSVDPVLDVKRAIREPQSWNRYSYVVNNPINRIDPDGRVDQNWDGGAAQQLFPDDRAAQLEFDQNVAEKTAALSATFVGGLGVRGAFAGGVALYRSFQVANALRVAAAGGAALSGGTRDMATQAFKMTASLPGSAAQKVQYFQSLATQISKASGGAWNATKIAGPNGSTVFFGKAGEALVINSKGQVFRGQLGTAVKVVKDTAEIAWDKMKLVQ